MTSAAGGNESSAPTTTVGWDGSESARWALLWAVERERRGMASGLRGLLLLAVADEAFSSRGSAAMAELAEAARTALDAEVGWISSAVPEIAIEARVVRGDPATALTEICPPDALIVVGHRFHAPGTGRALAARLAAASTQPVVVVSGAPDPASSDVVVGFDGTPAALRASLVGAAEAHRFGAALRIVHAWPGDGSPLLADVAEAADQRVTRERMVRQAAGAIRYDYPRLVVQERLEVGSAVEVLTRHAATAGLLVVGSRAQGPVRRFLLGSVSTALLETGGCPIAVVTAPRTPTG